jgi:hypothetical protein
LARFFPGRIFKQYRQTPLPQVRFDVLDQHLKMSDGVVIMVPPFAAAASRAIAVAVGDGGEQSIPA